MKERKNNRRAFIGAGIGVAAALYASATKFESGTDGPRPTGLRYCMNPVSVRFVKRA